MTLVTCEDVVFIFCAPVEDQFYLNCRNLEAVIDVILLEFLHDFLEMVLFVQNFLLSFEYVVLGEAPAHVSVG